VNRQGLGPKNVIFFSLLWLGVGLVGLAFSACSHTPVRSATSDAMTATVDPPAPGDSFQVISDEGSALPAPKRRSRRDIDVVEAELERERYEKQVLKEENDWLRVQVIQLQQELITANQNIYSLNRKLDAIFKSN
jgi:hypothetical protein